MINRQPKLQATLQHTAQLRMHSGVLLPCLPEDSAAAQTRDPDLENAAWQLLLCQPANELCGPPAAAWMISEFQREANHNAATLQPNTCLHILAGPVAAPSGASRHSCGTPHKVAQPTIGLDPDRETAPASPVLPETVILSPASPKRPTHNEAKQVGQLLPCSHVSPWAGQMHQRSHRSPLTTQSPCSVMRSPQLRTEPYHSDSACLT